MCCTGAFQQLVLQDLPCYPHIPSVSALVLRRLLLTASGPFPLFSGNTAALYACLWVMLFVEGQHFLSNFCSFSGRQLRIPELCLRTGTALDLVVCTLFFVFNSASKTNLHLLKYSFFNFSFSFLCSVSSFCSVSRQMYEYVFLWTLLFLNNFWHSFLIQSRINVTADCFHRFYLIFQIFLTSSTQFQAIHIQ